MNILLGANIWEMMHGGSTHLPVALMLVSAVFDALGGLIRSERVRDRFHAAGLFTLIAGTLGAFPAVLSGLILARWEIGGQGALFWHHVFLWPAFALLIGLSVWAVNCPGTPHQSRFLALSASSFPGCVSGQRRRILGWRDRVGRFMKRGFFGLEFIAALLAVVVASALVGGTLGAANLVRAGIEKARTEVAAGSPARLSEIAAHGQSCSRLIVRIVTLTMPPATKDPTYTG